MTQRDPKPIYLPRLLIRPDEVWNGTQARRVRAMRAARAAETINIKNSVLSGGLQDLTVSGMTWPSEESLTTSGDAQTPQLSSRRPGLGQNRIRV